MRIIKNRYFIAAVCFLIALIIAFIIVPSKNSKFANGTDVIRVNKIVGKNTQITEEMLIADKVIGTVSDKAFKSKNELLGKYTTTTIFPEDYITSDKVSDVVDDSNLYTLAQNGMYAVSVSLDSLSSSLSGKLMQGDIVNVLSFNTDQKTLVEHEDLKNIEVLSLSNSKGVDIESLKKSGAVSSADDLIPASVTLKVNEQQAKELIQMQNTGKVHLVFVSRGGANK